MNQNWTSFTVKIGVRSTLQTIYAAWTKSSEVEKWFLDSCTYRNENGDVVGTNELVELGASYEWTWLLYDVVEKGSVAQANGKDHFQFTFAGNCTVDVQLEEVDDHVLVTLVQSNIPTDEKSKFNIRIGCLQGWSFYLLNLKSYYENGHDLRNRNPKVKGVNN